MITTQQEERFTAMDYETKMKWVDLYLLGGSITKHIHKGKEYMAFYWSQNRGSDDCIDENNLIYVAMRQAVRAIGHKVIKRQVYVGDRLQIEFMSIAFDLPYEDWELMKHIYEMYSEGNLDDFTESEDEADSEDEEDDDADDENEEVSTQSMTHTEEAEESDDPIQ